MNFWHGRKATRPSNTVLRLESLDGRVLPSASGLLPAAPTLNQAVFDGGRDRHVSTFGGLTGGVFDAAGKSDAALSAYSVSLGGENYSVGGGGQVIPYTTRSSGEEIPQ